MLRRERSTIGRENELATLRSFLARRDGPLAFVLDGDAGIGKSTVWEQALREAAAGGSLVLRCRPTPSETQLAFAAIADLLPRDVLQHAGPSLSPPQRHALAVALQQEDADGAPPNVRAIAGAVICVLHHLAATAPVIVAIDDVQWLDAPSRTVLEFALRRLQGVAVAIVIARRSAGGEPLPLGLDESLGVAEVVRTTLAPMTVGALAELIRQRLDVSLARPTLLRVHEASGGNPFYALELARALRRSGDLDGVHLPLPDNLQSVVHARLADLAPEVLDLVQHVELLYDRRVDVVLRVAERYGLSASVDQAIDAGVLEVAGGRLTFTHPLLASAVHNVTGPARRAALHRRLAGLETTGEARALHLAYSAGDPDGATATELEAAAATAAARGAAETAAQLYEHAARLTPEGDQDRRARRVVGAADWYTAAGAPGKARSLLLLLVEQQPAGRARAEALSLLGWIHVPGGGLDESVALHEQALAEAGDDLALTALIQLRLSVAEAIRGHQDASVEYGRAAVESAQRAADAPLLAMALGSLGQALLGRGAGAGPELRQGAAIERRLPEFLGQQSPTRRLAFALMTVDEPDEARVLYEEVLDRADVFGYEDVRVLVLMQLLELERRTGNWARAAEIAAEAQDLARQVSTPQERNSLSIDAALLDAGLGHVDRARARAVTALETAEGLADAIHVLHAREALGFLELSLGDAAAAVSWLSPATDQLLESDYLELAIYPLIVPNEIEALTMLGNSERADMLTAHLTELSDRFGRPWIRAMAARSRALVAAAAGDVEGARRHVRMALSAHEDLHQPLELARTLTLAGALDRRAKQRRTSRASLEQALAILDALPAPLWAARARGELARLGHQRRESELSATEEQIAELAAQGLSNPEIAAAVFVSRKTVEANLSKVYRKLGVRSRVELALLLSSTKPAADP